MVIWGVFPWIIGLVLQEMGGLLMYMHDRIPWFALGLMLMMSSVAWAETGVEQLLVMDLNHSEDVKPDVARTLTDLVTARFSERREFRTLSGEDIRKLLEIEGEKQALGCDDGESCLAEIAGAMGARFVVYGRISRLGDVLVLQLNLFDAQAGIPILRKVLEADNLGAFTKLLRPAVQELSAAVMEQIGGSSDGEDKGQGAGPKKEESASDGSQGPSESGDGTVATGEPSGDAAAPDSDAEGGFVYGPWLLMGAGGAGVVAGVPLGALGTFFLAYLGYNFFQGLTTTDPQKYNEAKTNYESASGYFPVGLALVGMSSVNTVVSLALLGGGVGWFFASGDEE
jgi:hypothetical protein